MPAVRARLPRASIVAVVATALLAAIAPFTPTGTARAAEPDTRHVSDATSTTPTVDYPRLGRERASQPPEGDPVDDQILIRYRPSTTARGREEVATSQALTPRHTPPDGQLQVVTARGRSTATVRRELAADPRVEAVAPNQRRELAVDPASALDPAKEPSFAQEWGLHNTGQFISGSKPLAGVADVDIDGLQALASGIGDPNVVVAVIDDGVDFSHPDLASRAWINPGEAGAKATNGIDDDHNGYVDDVHGWDFCNDDATVHDSGQDGHGTHVAGTIAASLDGIGTVGVAPGVRIMGLKFIDEGFACGSDAQAVEAIDYAASFGVRIINASWGGPEPSSVLDSAIIDSDALFVAAAGNSGSNLDASALTRFYPASSTAPNVISVAAVDQTGHLASFSNYGATSVDIGAPGTNILSTHPASSGCPSPCYAWSAGTSMAAPHVAGVAALVGSRQASLLDDPVAMRARLLAAGRPLAALTGKTASGRMVNALRSIDIEPPVVRAPDRFGYGAGTVLGSGTVTTYVRWPSAADALSGVVGYGLRRQGPEGWTDVAVTGKSIYTKTNLRLYQAYRFRLRATDGVGNVGGPSDSIAITPRLHADSTKQAKYGTGWSTRSTSGATNGSTHMATRSGSSMTFTFRGRAIGLVAPKSASRGDVKIYIDGLYRATVSLYRSKSLSRVVVYATSWPTAGEHTLRLVVAGTPGHSRVDIDGFLTID